MTGTGDVVLEARGISKSFPGVRALDGVSLTLRSGRLTALLGENGAGKSTLMNVVAGVFPPDAGELLLAGQPVHFTSPRQARDHGIAMIFQELNLVPGLTVAENIFLGREPLRRCGLIDYAALNRRAAAWLQRLDLDIPPTAPTGRLRVGQQQVVEVAKALAGEARILIMDEPTSALSERETEVLFQRITDLKLRGVAIAYITHKLDELARIADDAAVMRDGRMIGSAPWKELSRPDIVRMMVGRDLGEPPGGTAISSPNQSDEVLRVEQLALPHPSRPGDFLVAHVSFRVRRGEVLGIFGLMGAGRTELLECLFGLHGRACTGNIFVGGRRAVLRSSADAIALGLAMAPEDRKRDGLVLSMSVAENTSLASLSRAERFGLIRPRAEREHVQGYLQRFRVKTPSLRQRVRNLSGGNQQKVILAKWLATAPRLLLLDEPTRGIDLRAKQEIYALIDQLTRDGLAVIVVSSELPEILTVSDRILVLCEGRATEEFLRAEATEEKIMHAALPRKPVSIC
ncbi:MAG: sugar ABC transporter ATP-binding protein [Planctomycetaceae bacterium]|nr:MAG: sugar ABC transporter ATP-binding protein [Planctomycetaceae bacterium]